MALSARQEWHLYLGLMVLYFIALGFLIWATR